MTHFPRPHPERRAPRIQLGGAGGAALVMLEDGHPAPASLKTVFVTGGLLHLAQSLNQGDFVEIAFHVQSGRVQGIAEVLPPARMATNGILQPFCFVALGDENHRALRMVLDSGTEQSLQGIRSTQWHLTKPH